MGSQDGQSGEGGKKRLRLVRKGVGKKKWG